MARVARVVIPGLPHHVTQRGNRRESVFSTDRDRRTYLECLARFCADHGVRVLGYCLMGNHVHLVVIPGQQDSLAKALGRAHTDYARWFNVTRLQTGHLWQNRFYSCVLEGAHLGEALRYVELNPVRAGMVARPWEWPWSSATAHSTGTDSTGLLDMREWRERFTPESWRDVLAQGLLEADLQQRIREATMSGRPFGSDRFIRELEARTNRRLRPGRRGPKAKAAAADSAQLSLGVT